MTSYEKSAIRGYWRCGADTMQIAGIMECCQEVVIKIIVDYVTKNGKKKDNILTETIKKDADSF